MVQKIPYKVSTGLSSQFKNMQETCSCTKCDSLFCFSKRHFVDSCSCSCNNCKESKTCLFFTNRLVRVNESRSDATNAAPISAITSATGDNAFSSSKYTSLYKVESTKSNETVNTSKQSSNTLAIMNKQPSYTFAITNKQPSYTLAITNKQPSKTLAIAHKQPSAITNKQPSHAIELGYKVLGASGTEPGLQSIYSTQKKPFDSSLHAINKEVSAIKQSSCCVEPQQSAIPTPESHSCGHHRSAEIYKVPEQISCVSQERRPSSPGYVLELSTCKFTKSGTDTYEVKCVDNNQIKKKTSSHKNTENNICDESASECKSAKLAPDSPGYVIDMKNKNPCDCNESSKGVSKTPHDNDQLLESSGYVVDLTRGSSKQTAYKSTKSRTDTCEVKCVDNNQIKKKTSDHKNTQNNICDESASECKSAKLAPDSPGYVIDMKNKNPCDCNESSKGSKPPHDYDQLLDSSGYVFDFTGRSSKPKSPLEACKTIFTNQINAIKALCNTCIIQSNPRTCGEGASECKSAKGAPDTPGYNKNPCDCNESQENTQTSCCKEDDSKKAKSGSERMSRGYVFDVPKPYDTRNKRKKKGCDCNVPKLESDPPGYVYDFKNRIKNTCDCNVHKIVSDPPGYVYDFKQGLKGLKLQRKTTCDCKPLPDNLTYPPGYVYFIPSHKSKDKSKHQPGKPSSTIDTPRKKYYQGADLCSNCSEPNNSSEPTKYTFNICLNGPGKTKMEALENQNNDCSCSDSHKTATKFSKPISESQEPSAYKLELCKNILKIQKNAIETLDNLCLLQKNFCEFPPNQTESKTKHKYSQEPDSIKQQLCANILGTQLNAVGILHDGTCPAQENTCSYSCNEQQDGTKSLSCKELLPNVHETIKNSETLCNHLRGSKKSKSESLNDKIKDCDCTELSQNTSEQNVSNADIQKRKTESKKNKQNFVINYLETNRNGFESLRSSYKKTSCECNNKDSPGYLIELQQSKEGPTNKTKEITNNTGQKKKCDCEESRKRLSSSAGYILELDQYKHETVNKTRKLSKNIFELPKNAVDSLTNECQLKNCESRKRLSSSAGYILELDQYKHEPMNKTRKLSKNLFDVQRNTIESLNHTNLKKSCECSESQKRLSGSAGYILELQQYTNLPKNTSQRLTNIQEVKGDTIESLNKTCQKSCVCKKPSKIISDSPGYILELDQYHDESRNKSNKLSKNIFEIQKNTIESLNNTNKKKSCECSEGNKKISESAGYIVDLDNYKQELTTKTHKLSKNIFGIQKDTIESLTNPNHKKGCGCSDAGKRLSSSAGYILELEQYKTKLSNASKELSKTREVKENLLDIPNYICQKSCVCRKPSKIISDPPGYVLELEQYKQEDVRNDDNKCKCSEQKKKSESALELQEIVRQLSNMPKSISKDIPEIKTNIICQRSCVCRKPSKIISDPPGYVLELEQYKQQRLRNDNNKCECSQEKEKTFDPASERQEIGRQLSNFPKNSSKDISEIKTNTTCQKSCVCRKPSKIISDPPGYVLDLEQYKQQGDNHDNKKCKCSQDKKKTFDSASERQEIGRQLSNFPKNSSKDISEIKTNTTCQKSCVCRKPSKIISDPPGYVLDLEQYKQQGDNHDNNKCKCSQDKKKTFDPASERQEIGRQLSNFPKNSSKDISEIKTNTICQKSCVCRKPSKIISDPPGYVLDLEQYKQQGDNHDNKKCKCSQDNKKTFDPASERQEIGRQLSNFPKNSSKDISEIKTNTTCQKSCVCRKPSKIISDPPGYVLDLEQYKQQGDNHDNNKCKCSQDKKKTFDPASERQEIGRQLSNFPKDSSKDISEIKTNTTCQKSCVCRKPSKIISDPPGYVLDLEQYKQQGDNHDNKKCKCSQDKKKTFDPSERQEIGRQLSNFPKNSSKDISEIKTNTICQKSCVCRKPSKIISDPPGYVLDLEQYKQQGDNHDNNKCKCSQDKKKTFDPASERQEIGRQLSNFPKNSSKDISEIKTNTTCQKSCVCRKPSKIISDPPGYVLDLEQYKQQGDNHDNNKCKCSQEKKKTFDPASERQEIGRQLSNFPKDSSKDISEIKTNTTCQKSCVCRKPSKIISDPPGYVLELEQYKQEKVRNEDNKCKCSEHKNKLSNSAFELQQISRQLSNTPNKSHMDSHEIKTNTTCQKSCVCRKPSKIISDPPGYILDLEEYKQESKNIIGKNIFEIQRNTIETLNNANQKKRCACSESQKRSSAGYVLDLQQYAQAPSNTPHQFYNNKQEGTKGKNIFEIQRSAIESLNDANQKKKCACSDSQKRSSAGYVLDLQQYAQAPSNTPHQLYKNKQEVTKGKDMFEIQRSTIESRNDKNSCACSESRKRFSSSAGYIVELKQYKKEAQANADNSQSETCQCKDSSKKTYDPIACCVGDMDTNENRLKRKEAPIIPANGSDSCNCSEPLGNPFESPDKLYSDLRKIQGPTKNALEVCKNIYGTHLNTFDELDNTNQKPCCGYLDPMNNNSYFGSDTRNKKQDICNNPLDGQRYTKETLKDPYETCDCNQTENKKFEISKSTKVSLHDAKNTGNYNETSKSKFDLPEFLMALHEHVPTKNILEMCKSILDKQDNLNNKPESSKKVQDEDCSCDGKKKNESNITSQGNKNNTFDLCNHVGAPSAIQTLKNIYLPPRYTLEYTKNYEYPTNNIPIDQPVKELHSVKVSYSRTEVTGTAMLSAEVMDLPYTDFHDSVARKQDVSEKANKLSKYDIFKRIKEAYKACSCKVCECIIGKSPTRNEICECTPCECKDCTSYLDKMNYKSPSAPISTSHGSNFPCVRSNKGHYRGIEQRQTCDCKPCDCVKCTHLTQPCDCEPCQCTVCQRHKKVYKSRTLVVAPVGETVQRVSCTCSPCDCIECGQGFPATSRMTNEMSTATNRHALCRCEICLNDHCEHGGVDFCRCERQKGVMNKPVEKDTHDYDIRTASVVQKRQIKKDKNKLCSKHDTIAMFAALPYNFTTFAAKNKPSTTKTCSCEECECVSCVCKENAINAIKSSQLFQSHKSSTLSNYNLHDKLKCNSPQNCNCSNCECEICDKYFDAQYYDSKVSIEQNKNCVCNVCDCLNCEGESRVIKYSFNGLCQCSTCQCTDCEIKIINGMVHKYQCSKCRYENSFGDKCLSNPIVHPIKRGELLTPSTHRSKVQSLMLEKQRLALPMPSTKCETLKCDAYMQCQEGNRVKSLPKNNSLDNKLSGSAFSEYSSFETSPKTSCHKDYDGLTPMSQNINKSWESSCNSSGHDYPEYLIQFPKSTVETCLKDVMKLNMDKTIALDKFNIVSKKSSVKYQVDSMSNELMSEKNLSQSHGCNLISSCDCQTVTAECTESINQYHNVSNSCMDRNDYAYTPWAPDFIESTSCRNCKFEITNNNRLGAFESLQASEVSHRKCSECIKGSTSSITVTGCETKTETRKCFHILQNFNDVHVACKMLQCNTSEQKPANTILQIKNENFCAWKYSKPLPQGSFGGDVDSLNGDEYYASVQKTLKEAEEYSAELMQMLQMYEKANREFESIADKLKIPRVSVSKEVVVEDEEMQECVVKEEGFNEIEHELQEIPLEALSVREVLTSTSILQESRKPERTFAECENDFNTISKKMGRTELTTISDHETCNLHKGEYDLSNKISTANESLPLEQNEMCPDKAGTKETGNNSKDSVRIKKSLNTKTQDIGSIYDSRGSTLDCQRMKKKDRISGKNHKMYSKLLKRTIIISKRISLENSYLNTPNPIVKYCITEGTSAAEMNANSDNEKNYSIAVNNSEKESSNSYEYNNQRKYRENVILRKLDSVFGSEEVSVSASTDTYELERDFVSLNELDSSSMAQEEETRPWPILKKKYFKSKPNTKNKGVCIFPSLELQIKQAVQSISLQTSSIIAPKKKSIVPHHENKALAKLQDEVKKLLDMPILQLQTTATCRDNTKESLNIQSKNKLELELKETPEASFQSSLKDVKSVDKEVWCSFTREAVESLINDLLHLSVMKPLEKGTESINRTTDNIEDNGESPKFITPKCSCDALKVGFLGVRRVSDHTVLVKWNVPRKLAKVHGYELLVDGRAVQKIFSPTKSMAVVTCLPHTDKVLLTIRTITSSVSVTGHYPATTIIYRPRAKY